MLIKDKIIMRSFYLLYSIACFLEIGTWSRALGAAGFRGFKGFRGGMVDASRQIKKGGAPDGAGWGRLTAAGYVERLCSLALKKKVAPLGDGG